MDSQNISDLNAAMNEDSDKDLFKYYARPLTSKLLESMELSKYYFQGHKDYLYYEENNSIHRVLDLTGGYGANILGHRHPGILAKVQEWREKGTPSLTQGSIRHEAGKLAKCLSDILFEETSEGPWITTFSNSGTEAIEAAYKHCLIYFNHKLIGLKQEIEKAMNQSLIKIKSSEATFQKRLTIKLRLELSNTIPHLNMSEERKSYFLHQLSYAHSLDEVIALVRVINEKQMAERPTFIALEKAYHGKTMGSLSLTHNKEFRQSFFLDTDNSKTHFVSQFIDHESLKELINSTKMDLIFLGSSESGITWVKHSFSSLGGAFVEPIQGEAGVIEISSAFLALLKKYSLQEDFLLVFDEIQSGMYRTGKLSAGTLSDITADIYTFSKSLGGGIAKIAATTINQRKYVEEFGLLHSSTFSDDDFSSSVALEVLNIIRGVDSPLAEGMKVAGYLMARLETLKSLYPEVIQDVRGQGLLLALEFSDKFSELGFEFKAICDSNMQGYALSSALLNHEGIRMSPSLSNNLTLRIQPSLYITIIQVEQMMAGLMNVCEALTHKNIKYFLSAIYPGEDLDNKLTPELKIDVSKSKNLAVFLCHLIDEDHLQKISTSLKNVDQNVLRKKLALSKDIAQFEIYHSQTILDNAGNEMEIVLLAVPITSAELKRSYTSRQKYKLVQKIQTAIDYAKELGASTVGLGQFTSIVSGNGLYLNSRGMSLTTGNAYTTALTIESALLSAKENSINIPDATVALIGSAGNIMSVTSSLMADHVGKVIMIHHSPLEASNKFQSTTKRILNEIASSSSESKVTKVIKSTWTKDSDLLTYLDRTEVKEVLVCTSDISLIHEAEIVLCGANASTGFLDLSLFKKNSVVVDIAVPQSIKPEILVKLKKERPDITYHLGGIARIPKDQSIDCVVFPLSKNECFACMAETFAIGFTRKTDLLNIGDLTKNMVLEIQELTKLSGFGLSGIKNKNSL